MMFVQVGKEAFNMDLVKHIVLLDGKRPEVLLEYVSDDDAGILVDDQAKRFLAWWDNKAEVYKA